MIPRKKTRGTTCDAAMVPSFNDIPMAGQLTLGAAMPLITTDTA